MPDNEIVFESADDPYYTLVVWSDEDTIHIRVTPEGIADTAISRHEIGRRVMLLRNRITQWLSPEDVWSRREDGTAP